MIGDNYDTDIMAGMNAGLETLLVHTGITTKEKLKEYDRKPTHVARQFSPLEFLKRKKARIFEMRAFQLLITQHFQYDGQVCLKPLLQ